MEIKEVQRQTRGTLGVLLTHPADPYLESELERRFRLFRIWHAPPERRADFLRAHSASIRALVCDTTVGADASTIDLLPKLGIVSTFSVGLDKVDLDKCREKGIRVTNTPGVVTDDVADLAVGLAIAVLRKMCTADKFVRDGAWKRKKDFELTAKFSGKSIGVVGLGRIGLAIAKRAEAFGCPISYHSRSEKQSLKYKYYPSIVELAQNTDVLMVSCPATDETYHIINKEVMQALGSKGVLINIGRGSLVDEKELVSALEDGLIGGAGLDVFEHEPHPSEELFKLENVVLLPHVGTSTYETCREMANLVINNLEAYLQNMPLLTPVL